MSEFESVKPRDALHLIGVALPPAIFLWILGTAVYRRYFHPLSKVPGPFLGSLSELYYFYWQYIKNGSLYLQFERLTKEYGPVIRIGPNEVVLTDPENYDKIYTAHTKFYKDPNMYARGGGPTGIFSTIPNDAHRKYRAILNPFFSRRAMLDEEELVQQKALKLCRDIEKHRRERVPTNVHDGFRAISMDVITEYAFGPDNGWDFLESEDYGSWYGELTRMISQMIYLFRLIPPLAKMRELPHWLAVRLNPVMKGYIGTTAQATKVVEATVRDIDAGVKPKQNTIFHTILSPENPHGRVSVQHMVDEAWVITAAAAETTGNALTVIAFRVVNDPVVYAKLHAELKEAFPDPDNMPYLELEKLPYLTAVIKEGLRLSYGIVHHLPRVVPEGGATFNGYFLPEGTVVGMSNWTMHRLPAVFPDPDKFDPERWLDPDKARHLDKYLTIFSRGNRMCIGRFDDLRSYETRAEDMVYEDYFAPFHPVDAKPLKLVGPEFFE
ncbi:Trichodiene oxygenase [Pleurostoma richardsiae]|uniref:Trichodiene oxygenase n=1 Tax=Pleurostoma richardsiae TaxID=41990 RepID=A0AA38RWE0_9PEZI|nr:Trichodiene oxygenase [Pleurostoma richardsiae]